MLAVLAGVIMLAPFIGLCVFAFLALLWIISFWGA